MRMSGSGSLATLRAKGGEDMALAHRIQKLERAITPEPVIHIFEFVGFCGEHPSSSRTERRGPKGERLVYIGFEPVRDGTLPEPEPETPSPHVPPAKPIRRTRQRSFHQPVW
jgi:hypothetical protein